MIFPQPQLHPTSFPSHRRWKLLSYTSIYHLLFFSDLGWARRFEIVKTSALTSGWNIIITKFHLFFCNPPQTNKKIFDLYFWFKSPHQFKRMNQMNHSLGVMCDGNGPFYFLDFSWKKPFGLFLFHIVSFSVTEGFLKYDKILLNRNLEGKTYPFAASKKLFWRRGDWHDCVKFKNPLCGLGSCIFWVWKYFHSLQVETMQIVLNYF